MDRRKSNKNQLLATSEAVGLIDERVEECQVADSDHLGWAVERRDSQG
jgi:hypothetical protein